MSLFKKINYLMLGSSVLIIILNCLKGLSLNYSFIQLICHPSIFIILSTSIFFIFCIFYENTLSKYIQISMLFVLGLVSLLGDPFSFYSIGIWSVLLFLSYSYQFLEHHLRLKLVLYITTSLGCFYISLLVNHRLEVNYLFSIGYFLLYYVLHIVALFVIFSTKIKEYEQEILSKKVVSEIGERASMLIHDTKGILQKIEGSMYFLSDITTDRENMKPFINIINNTLREVNNRFESLLYINKESVDSFDLISLLNSVIYLYQLTPKGRDIRFITHFREDSITIKGSKLDFITLFDNIIKNSMEAGCSVISIELFSINKSIFMSFFDNGIGILQCEECKIHNCIDCKLVSNKVGGNGLGTKSIGHVVRKYRGEILYSPNNDTTGITLTILL